MSTTQTFETLFKTHSGRTILRQLSAALRLVAAAAQREAVYDALFLQKKSVFLPFSRDLHEAAQCLSSYDLLTSEANGARLSISSNIMLHHNPHRMLKNVPQPLDALTDILIATDWPDIPPRMNATPYLVDGRDMVFPLHYETLLVIGQLAQHVSGGRAFPSALDLFCGSGILGIYAAKLGTSSVTFGDNYLRPLTFSMLNAFLNSVEGATPVKTDCCAELDSEYDLILANPPFEAVTNDEHAFYFHHSVGGSDGQFYIKSLLTQYHNFLLPNGLVIAVDFMLTDAHGGTVQAELQDFLSQQLIVTPPRVVLTTFDAISLKEFWSRYGFFNIDPMQRLLREHLLAGHSMLLLCTLELDLRASAPAVSFHTEEGAPPKAAWWNPLRWPLPCGVTTDASSLACYIHQWRSYELESFSEQSALAGEALTSYENTLPFWDFTPVLHRGASGYDASTSETLHMALFRIVVSAKKLLLANVASCESAALYLLPSFSMSQIWCIKGPDFSEVCKPSFDLTRRSLAESLTSALSSDSFRTQLSSSLANPFNLFLLFTVTTPASAFPRRTLSLHELELYRSTVGHFALISNGCIYSPDNNYLAAPATVDHLLAPLTQPNCQGFVLHLAIRPEDLPTLELMTVFLKNATPPALSWQAVVADQLYHFLRDQLTLIAIAALFSKLTNEHVEKATREITLRATMQAILSLLSHNLKNIATRLPYNASGADVRIYLGVWIFTIDAAQLFEAPPLFSHSWATPNIESLQGFTIGSALEKMCSDDKFTLTITARFLNHTPVYVDARMVALLMELGLNMHKRHQTDPQGLISIDYDSESSVCITAIISARGDQARQYALRLLAADPQNLGTLAMKLRGVTFLAALAAQLGSRLEVAIHNSAPNSCEQPVKREEGPGWILTAPLSLLEQQINYDHLVGTRLCIEQVIRKVPVSAKPSKQE